MERTSPLPLVELIYAAALEPARWQEFARALSRTFGDAVTGFALHVPGFPSSRVLYSVGFEPPYRTLFLEHALRGLPWEQAHRKHFVGRFGLASEVIPDALLARSAFYRECMEPQGLMHGPMGHTIAIEDGRPFAGVLVFPGPGHGPFGRDDLEFGNLLVPHLALAYRIHAERRQHQGMSEAIDRFPTGVLLLDVQGHVLRMNRAAQEIVEQRDGLALEGGALRASRPAENARLRQIVASTIEGVTSGRSCDSNVMTVSRRSERRAFPLVVAPLRAPASAITGADTVAVVYVSDLDRGLLFHREALRELYGLTEAETRLVELLCQGLSLEEGAEARGVTINTARSQLKQVFAKTGTSRQGELVGLVLAGVSSIGGP